MAPSHPTA